jgi:hypothetical protein
VEDLEDEVAGLTTRLEKITKRFSNLKIVSKAKVM